MMFSKMRIKSVRATLLTNALVACLAVQLLSAQAGTEAMKRNAAVNGNEYRPSRFSKRAELHYGLVWGVDSLSVKWAESGEMIRFSYHIIDASKAAMLNDVKEEPSLFDLQVHVSLVIPSLEKVGKLRQRSTPVEGRSSWMGFSNKGRLVKRDDRVTVIIGQFRAEGLVVD